jgi:hypothetical protein
MVLRLTERAYSGLRTLLGVRLITAVPGPAYGCLRMHMHDTGEGNGAAAECFEERMLGIDHGSTASIDQYVTLVL